MSEHDNRGRKNETREEKDARTSAAERQRQARLEREARALRQNLMRRKQQQRNRPTPCQAEEINQSEVKQNAEAE